MYVKTNGYNDTPPDRVKLLKTAAVFLGRDGTVRRAFPDAGSVPNAAPAADAPAPAGAADKS